MLKFLPSCGSGGTGRRAGLKNLYPQGCESSTLSSRRTFMDRWISKVDRRILAYIVGVALGDGNLSNPNGRAVRLRVTCDTRYPLLILKIQKAIQAILPLNKVGLVRRSEHCVDISSYSRCWEKWLGWKSGKGSKFQQNVSVPKWIMAEKRFRIPCLKGLIETDGSLYVDRGYKMVNFVTTIPKLAKDVMIMVAALGFQANLYQFSGPHKMKYTVRISKNVSAFISVLNLEKVKTV